MSTATRPYGTFPTTVRAADVGHGTPTPGTVYVAGGVIAGIEATARVQGVQIVARVIEPDTITSRRRIVLHDLVEDALIVDTWLDASVGTRTAIALAEGLVRGYALSMGVEVR